MIMPISSYWRQRFQKVCLSTSTPAPVVPPLGAGAGTATETLCTEKLFVIIFSSFCVFDILIALLWGISHDVEGCVFDVQNSN